MNKFLHFFGSRTLFLLIPISQLALSSFFYFAQGGFGGGHGEFDGFVILTQLPGILVWFELEGFELFDVMISAISDSFIYLVIPFLINFFITVLIIRIVNRVKGV